jgi:hypothetical protein
MAAERIRTWGSTRKPQRGTSSDEYQPVTKDIHTPTFANDAYSPRYACPPPSSSWWICPRESWSAVVAAQEARQHTINHRKGNAAHVLRPAGEDAPKRPAETICRTCKGRLTITQQHKGLVRCTACRRSNTQRTRRAA